MNVFENQANIEGHSALSISVSTTADSAFIDTPGVYAVWSTVDTKIKIDTTAARAETVTTANGFPITAASPVLPLRITRPAFLGAIASENGTLYYHRIL